MKLTTLTTMSEESPVHRYHGQCRLAPEFCTENDEGKFSERAFGVHELNHGLSVSSINKSERNRGECNFYG